MNVDYIKIIASNTIHEKMVGKKIKKCLINDNEIKIKNPFNKINYPSQSITNLKGHGRRS
jgi:hypothetical protein